MRLVPYVRRSDFPARTDPGNRSIFEEFLDDFFAPLNSGTAASRWMPAVDVLEKKGEWILRAEIPGINENDIELKLDGGVLTLRGERKFEQEEDRQNYTRVERSYGSFSRSFTLPSTADREKISADYKDGVLTVTIPQKPEARPREIEVKVH
jgi:HSP20 family protein